MASSHTEEEWLCEAYGSKFACKQFLNKHKKGVHGGERFACELCSKTYSRKDQLQTHMAVYGLDLKPYKCDMCGKQFKLAAYLRSHLKWHENPASARDEARVSHLRQNDLC